MAVMKEGRIVQASGYGLANMETDTPATPETEYRIASISKQFIATAVLLLVQEGKVGLDDKISKYLDGSPETWKEISVRQLLTHTSGIVRCRSAGMSPRSCGRTKCVSRMFAPISWVLADATDTRPSCSQKQPNCPKSS
jgi:CubicO group peptidase (beta-lactamase class C family)